MTQLHDMLTQTPTYAWVLFVITAGLTAFAYWWNPPIVEWADEFHRRRRERRKHS